MSNIEIGTVLRGRDIEKSKPGTRLYDLKQNRVRFRDRGNIFVFEDHGPVECTGDYVVLELPEDEVAPPIDDEGLASAIKSVFTEGHQTAPGVNDNYLRLARWIKRYFALIGTLSEVVDGEGDKWYLADNGLYSAFSGSNATGTDTLKDISRRYGGVTLEIHE